MMFKFANRPAPQHTVPSPISGPGPLRPAGQRTRLSLSPAFATPGRLAHRQHKRLKSVRPFVTRSCTVGLLLCLASCVTPTALPANRAVATPAPGNLRALIPQFENELARKLLEGAEADLLALDPETTHLQGKLPSGRHWRLASFEQRTSELLDQHVDTVRKSVDLAHLGDANRQRLDVLLARAAVAQAREVQGEEASRWRQSTLLHDGPVILALYAGGKTPDAWRESAQQLPAAITGAQPLPGTRDLVSALGQDNTQLQAMLGCTPKHAGVKAGALLRDCEPLAKLRRTYANAARTDELPAPSTEFYRYRLYRSSGEWLDPAQVHHTAARRVAEIRDSFSGRSLPTATATFTDEQRQQELLTNLADEISAQMAHLGAWLSVTASADLVLQRVAPDRTTLEPVVRYIGSFGQTERPAAVMVNLQLVDAYPPLARAALMTEMVAGHHLAAEAAPPWFGQDYTTSALDTSGWAAYITDFVGSRLSDGPAKDAYTWHQLLRNTRVVVDTGVHAFGWTNARAQSFFVQTLGISTSAAATEVSVIRMRPAEAIAYWQRLHVLKSAAARMTRATNEKWLQFHNSVMALGPLPPAALAKALGVNSTPADRVGDDHGTESD